MAERKARYEKDLAPFWNTGMTGFNLLQTFCPIGNTSRGGGDSHGFGNLRAESPVQFADEFGRRQAIRSGLRPIVGPQMGARKLLQIAPQCRRGWEPKAPFRNRSAGRSPPRGYPSDQSRERARLWSFSNAPWISASFLARDQRLSCASRRRAWEKVSRVSTRTTAVGRSRAVVRHACPVAWSSTR